MKKIMSLILAVGLLFSYSEGSILYYRLPFDASGRFELYSN